MIRNYSKLHFNVPATFILVDAMLYTSTRDDSKLYTFEEAICVGYATDGGLFVPQTLPERIDAATLKAWSTLNYIELATNVLERFLSPEEVSRQELHNIINSSLSGFPNPSHAVPVVPIPLNSAARLEGNKNKVLYVVELFHGPTFCFKDLSLQFVVHMLDFFSRKRNRQTTLIVSTTGDTGPAAVQAVNDLNSPYLSILVHYPQGQISDFQRKQLTTCNSDRVLVAAFQGGGDDMDAPIKRIIQDGSFSRTNKRLVCGINSYNIARPLMQMIHFIWTYLRVVQQESIEPGDPDFKLDFILPTGAMGNMAGGYLAKQMGIPLGILCAGVNVNDITHRAFQTGIVQKSAEMKVTMSEAINIQMPYNLERLLFYLTEQNHKQIKEWYSQLEEKSSRCMIVHATEWFTKLQKEFHSARVTDEELCDTLGEVLRDLEYWADPNTGVAFCAGKKLGYCLQPDCKGKFALLATASPCKFESVIAAALGKEKWEEYFKDYFPSKGKEILSKAERPLILYEAVGSLEECQKAWEQKARSLIQGL